LHKSKQTKTKTKTKTQIKVIELNTKTNININKTAALTQTKTSLANRTTIAYLKYNPTITINTYYFQLFNYILMSYKNISNHN